MTARTKALLALLGLAIILLAAGFLPIQEWLRAFSAWVAGAGATGIIAYVGLYVCLVGIGFPALPLTLMAGIIYGPIMGTLLVSPASTLGAFLAFLLGRYFFRDWVRRRAVANSTLGALDAAIEKEGWRMVALLRLSPVFPFNLVNLTLGSTGIKPIPYVLASWIAMLPGTLLFVSLGAAAGQITGVTTHPRSNPWMLGIGILATILLTIRITQIARKALASRLPGSKPA